jgi:hypothetical protein
MAEAEKECIAQQLGRNIGITVADEERQET